MKTGADQDARRHFVELLQSCQHQLDLDFFLGHRRHLIQLQDISFPRWHVEPDGLEICHGTNKGLWYKPISATAPSSPRSSIARNIAETLECATNQP
mmetsp:Transcript_16182/g.21172  ORF Transcript_16182/g.21172 Transcript_16182/m.21172 type:complete len:97 (-) Transcript_16182:342-632(-)